jgi:hypothetical protein
MGVETLALPPVECPVEPDLEQRTGRGIARDGDMAALLAQLHRVLVDAGEHGCGHPEPDVGVRFFHVGLIAHACTVRADTWRVKLRVRLDTFRGVAIVMGRGDGEHEARTEVEPGTVGVDG